MARCYARPALAERWSAGKSRATPATWSDRFGDDASRVQRYRLRMS
jgi:hypothetical protein